MEEQWNARWLQRSYDCLLQVQHPPNVQGFSPCAVQHSQPRFCLEGDFPKTTHRWEGPHQTCFDELKQCDFQSYQALK